MRQKRLVVIGGGAAGFFCAVNAASLNPNLEVIIAEKTSKLLTKVKVSGGGRCNVAHACFSIADMVKNYPRGAKFLKKSFHQFFTKNTIEWFASKGIALHTEVDGRIFPESNSSETIINCLLHEANKHHVQILMNHEVNAIEKNEAANFVIHFKNAPFITCDFLCISCGGFAKPEQYKWITDLGHTYETPVPSLFTFNIPHHSLTELMGISIERIQIKINELKLSQSGPILITHWGFSGPAVLKLSSFAARELAMLQYHFNISINWLSDFNENTLLEKLRQTRLDNASRKISNKNPFNLPQRFWEYHLSVLAINNETRWADLPAKQQNALAKELCSQQFCVNGKTTFKDEFVTAGGVHLNEIDATTMQSKILPHLYFAGEIMNVDGITGGYNFQHAWTSGYLSGSSIAISSDNDL